MKKPRYKDQKIKSYRKRVVFLIILMFILILVSFLALKILQNNIAYELTYNNLSSIKDVIEYYESTYISETEHKTGEFKLDVYLKFKMLPYNEDETSNERYYMSLIEDGARVLKYKNFRLYDNENDIKVEVVCKNNKIVSVKINDIEDYFVYMDSQISLKKYEEIPITYLNVQSPILQSCIDSNWTNVDFGARDSIFYGYYIYHDEGIKVRNIDGRIYNVVFTKNYKGTIVDDLFPGIDFQSIQAKLGTPSFKDGEVIGYKSDKFYIFFTETEVSVYRNEEVDISDFFALADKFLADEIDLLDFMNELTYIWPDYSVYKYASNYMYISYPLKGIEISVNYSDTNGILVYNNIRGTLSNMEKYLKNTNFVSRLKLDLVYEAEKYRFKEESDQLELCKDYEESLDEEQRNIMGKSDKYRLYPLKDENGYIYSMYFISSLGDCPNRELNDSVSSFIWITNDLLVYSKPKVGLFKYNLLDGRVERFLTGDEEFNIKGFGNGILKYDDKEIQLQY